VYSLDKVCYLYESGDSVIIETEDKDYFYNFFDLDTDYEKIYNYANLSNREILVTASNLGRGVRILRQNAFEMLFSFIISQNNNIKRISKTIDNLCKRVGKEFSSPFGVYNAFPTAEEMAVLTIEDFKALGFGYRGDYFISLIDRILNGFDIESLKNLDDESLRSVLLGVKGVGDKVANCVMLFGFYRTKSFPVDTWIEKIYTQNFNGTLKDRTKIKDYFISEFGDYSGYIQQYLFYYKRSLESKE
jgi:N-glycosylase/DNA lyase